MKKSLIFAGMCLLVLSTFSAAEALTITSMVGDMDNFGTGIPLGEPISYDAFHNAQRTPEDGDMDIDYSVWGQETDFSWQHIFELSTDAVITSARLTISTFDLEDAGAGDGLGGEPYDELLFLDGVELLGAFDDTFTADDSPVMPNTSIFELTPNFWGLLTDGYLEVLVNSYGGQRQDCIAIDYAILEIEISNVPEPTTMVLLGIGIIGLVVARRKR